MCALLYPKIRKKFDPQLKKLSNIINNQLISFISFKNSINEIEINAINLDSYCIFNHEHNLSNQSSFENFRPMFIFI